MSTSLIEGVSWNEISLYVDYAQLYITIGEFSVDVISWSQEAMRVWKGNNLQVSPGKMQWLRILSFSGSETLLSLILDGVTHHLKQTLGII